MIPRLFARPYIAAFAVGAGGEKEMFEPLLAPRDLPGSDAAFQQHMEACFREGTTGTAGTANGCVGFCAVSLNAVVV